MGGLLDSLSSATNALTAARLGMDVAGQNIGNINTPGYTRRMLNLAEVPPTDTLSAGRGVEVVGIRALRDELLEARLAREAQSQAFQDAVAHGLTALESMLGNPGEGLDERLSAFFDSFSVLANDPTSASARHGVVSQATALAQAFRQLADRFSAARREADANLRTTVDEVNQLAAEVARLNDQIVAGGSDAESLRDARALALARLVEIGGVSITPGSDGAVDLSIGQGRPLVVGAHVYTVSTQSAGSLGLSTIVSEGLDLTGEITSGEIGGLLHVRDTLVPQYEAALDAMAHALATSVNTVHATGFDRAGAAGGNFFVSPSAIAGAAAVLAVDAALALDPALVAASGTGAAGDNQTARALAALSGESIDRWGQLLYRFGSDLASADTSSRSHQEVVTQLQQMRDRASGVSLDEEAANLMRFQRAYQASARYFTTISDTLDSLMNMVR